MNERDLHEIASALVSLADKLDDNGLTRQLSKMPVAERLELARRIDEINARYQRNSASLPDFMITAGSDVTGAHS